MASRVVILQYIHSLQGYSMDAKGRPEGNISLDQRAAESVAGSTRFPSLTIGSEGGYTVVARCAGAAAALVFHRFLGLENCFENYSSTILPTSVLVQRTSIGLKVLY